VGLRKYWKKRDFAKTPEPSGKRPARRRASKLRFCIQKHAASHLHYDFRLEMEGVLRSWAVPKGPSLDPKDRRLAVHVEDHPISYGGFEGTIPEGQYGGGTVLLWDRGTWEPDEDPVEMYRRGRIKFRLHGKKLSGAWMLLKMRAWKEGAKENWLLIKDKDESARRGKAARITELAPESVKTGRARKAA
jgi:bifunctional non-homologous end joining protein LigD